MPFLSIYDVKRIFKKKLLINNAMSIKDMPQKALVLLSFIMIIKRNDALDQHVLLSFEKKKNKLMLQIKKY